MIDSSRNARSRDVADALGVSAARVRAYARAGRIPYRRTPRGHYRFDIAEVLSLFSPAPAIEARGDLVDLRASEAGVIVDALSAHRGDPLDAASLSRLRAAGYHGRPRYPRRRT